MNKNLHQLIQKVKINSKANNVDNVYKNTKKAKVISGITSKNLKVKGLRKGTTTLKIIVSCKTLKLKVRVN